MATASLPVLRWNSLLAWLPDFLREELSPYPGRVALVFRMVVAATLITIVGMTFRIPYTFQGVIYALMISLGVPLWDRLLPSETNVEDTLWLCFSVVIGAVITAAVELVFERRRPGDDVVIPISDRLSAIERLMIRYAEGPYIDAATKEQIMQFAMRGTSLLRRILRRSDYPIQYSVEMGGVTALVGRLVDLAATLTQLQFEASASDQKRLRDLASALANIRNELLSRRIPDPLQFNPDEEPAGVPLLREI